jgi:hypothetical protein
MVDKNDALIREIDEELRRERLAKLWERHGTWLLVAAAAIVVAVAAFKWNEQRQIEAAQLAGARFEAASNLAAEGKADEALKAYSEIAEKGPPGYGALAALRHAGGLAQAGKTAEALAAYETLSRNGEADALLRDFARLQAAGLRLGQADWTEMQNRLNDLAADKAPWRHFARELMGIAALNAGKADEARKVLEPMVADPALPQGVAERVRVLMGQVIAAEQAAPSASAAPAGTTAPAQGPAESKQK